MADVICEQLLSVRRSDVIASWFFFPRTFSHYEVAGDEMLSRATLLNCQIYDNLHTESKTGY